MLRPLPPDLVPFAKIKEEDVQPLTTLLDHQEIDYHISTSQEVDTSDTTTILHVTTAHKAATQATIDRYFKKKKARKPSSFMLSTDKKFILGAVIFLLWILFKQYMKSGMNT